MKGLLEKVREGGAKVSTQHSVHDATVGFSTIITKYIAFIANTLS